MITIQFDDRQVLGALQELQRKAADLRPAMDDIGAGLVSRIQQSMGRGQTPWGDAMAALKLRQGVPLNDTRQHIYNRITHQANETSVTVGLLDSDSNRIGRVHQFGATIKPVNGKFLVFKPRGYKRPIFARQVTIPARPFMPIRNSGQVDLPPEWAQEVVDIAHDHLQKGSSPRAWGTDRFLFFRHS